jgi:hypothetical protein
MMNASALAGEGASDQRRVITANIAQKIEGRGIVGRSPRYQADVRSPTIRLPICRRYRGRRRASNPRGPIER